MNIGIVSTWFERGAAYVSKGYKDVLEKEHNVFIYARGGESYALENPDWDNDRVTWAKPTVNNIYTYFDLSDFQLWLKRNEIQIVFFNEQHWWEPILLCHDKKIITGAYVDYYTENTIPFYAAYDFLICNTRKHYNVFSWHPQCYYIPWGTDTMLFAPKTIHIVNSGVITFFHSAGMNPRRKGCDLVIKAFSRLRGPAKVIIHSQKPLKEVYPEMAGVISDLESRGKLVIIEKTVTAPGLYHLGDVYVYPSRLEGIGLTISEALSCGLPVITCNNSPMNEFVDESNGKLVQIERLWARADGYYWPQCLADLDDLTDAMQFYIDNMIEIGTYKAQARNSAVNKLDWRNNTSNLSSLFASVCFVDSPAKKKIMDDIRTYENKRKIRIYEKSHFINAICNVLYRIIKLSKLRVARLNNN